MTKKMMTLAVAAPAAAVVHVVQLVRLHVEMSARPMLFIHLHHAVEAVKELAIATVLHHAIPQQNLLAAVAVLAVAQVAALVQLIVQVHVRAIVFKDVIRCVLQVAV